MSVVTCTCAYRIFGLEGLNFLKELVCEVLDLLSIAHVLQPQLVLILHLEFIHSRL